MVRDRTQGRSPHPLWVSGLLRDTDERLIVQAQHCPLAFGVLQVLGEQVSEVSAGLVTMAVKPKPLLVSNSVVFQLSHWENL